MPQRQFWTERHAVGWAAVVAMDPTDPHGPSQLALKVYDQSHSVMEACSMQVPAMVLHEAVSGLLHCCWESWLFGEPGDMTATMKEVGRRWREEARLRLTLP